MLAYILAIAVGLGSFALYMSAFFFPEVHRKNDFVWSGVGLFYALILWACAGRFTGAVLLGQLASVSLLGWLGWQTLSLRRELTPVTQQTPIPADLKTQVNGFFRRPPTKIAPKAKSKIVSPPEVTTPNHNIVLPETTVEEVSPSLTENIDNNIAPGTQFTSPISEPVEVNEAQETVPSVPFEVEEVKASPTEETVPSLTAEEEIVEIVEESLPNPATLETAEPTVVPPSDSTGAEPPAPVQPNLIETSIPVSPVAIASPKPEKPPKPPSIGGRLSGLLGTLTGLFQKKPKNTGTKPASVEKTNPVVSVPSSEGSLLRDQTPMVDQVTPLDADFDEFDELESAVAENELTEDTVASVESVVIEPETSTEVIIPEVIETVEVTRDNVETEPVTRSPFEEMVSSTSTVEVVIEMTDEQLNQIADAVEEKLTENLSSITAEIVEVIEAVSESNSNSEASEPETTIPPSLVRPNPPDPDLKAAAQPTPEPSSQPESPMDS